jgi:hypothetical protein
MRYQIIRVLLWLPRLWKSKPEYVLWLCEQRDRAQVTREKIVRELVMEGRMTANGARAALGLQIDYIDGVLRPMKTAPKDGTAVVIQLTTTARAYWDEELKTWVLCRPMHIESVREPKGWLYAGGGQE